MASTSAGVIPGAAATSLTRGPVLCQGAGLVEINGTDAGQGLQGGTALP